MECSKCGKPLNREHRVASMSGSIMGDEHTDSYFLCPICKVYTIVKSWDNFTGEETITTEGPLPKESGDERVATILKCPEPWDKKCRCPAHREYFRGTLD